MHARICAGYSGKDIGSPSKSLSTKARLVEMGDTYMIVLGCRWMGWLKTLDAMRFLEGKGDLHCTTSSDVVNPYSPKISQCSFKIV